MRTSPSIRASIDVGEAFALSSESEEEDGRADTPRKRARGAAGRAGRPKDDYMDTSGFATPKGGDKDGKDGF